jgi:hypothetical protein
MVVGVALIFGGPRVVASRGLPAPASSGPSSRRSDLCVFVCACESCMYVCMYVCMNACMHARTHVCMYVCMYLFIYECMHVCMYVCIYAYIWHQPHHLLVGVICMHICMGAYGRSIFFVSRYIYMYVCIYKTPLCTRRRPFAPSARRHSTGRASCASLASVVSWLALHCV